MKVVIQRVSEASVVIGGEVFSEIGNGLMILLGIENTDSEEDITWLSKKISQLRIFNDDSQVMNLSVCQVNGEILVISQFTLHARTKKGNRPSYMDAAGSEISIPLYERFVEVLRQETNLIVKTGVFGADMKVYLINDGPVTIVIDSKNKI
jgi:D-tyrosyl-tRNA(Tyr) deacylase